MKKKFCGWLCFSQRLDAIGNGGGASITTARIRVKYNRPSVRCRTEAAETKEAAGKKNTFLSI